MCWRRTNLSRTEANKWERVQRSNVDEMGLGAGNEDGHAGARRDTPRACDPLEIGPPALPGAAPHRAPSEPA